MPAAPFPENEAERLATLRRHGLLDATPRPTLDLLCELASSTFDAPVALVSLVDAQHQQFKASVGVLTTETPREHAFCAYAILDDEPLVVEDATADTRFVDNPLVTGAPGIRFYAGAPLEVEPGIRLGTLCLIDCTPRDFGLAERQRLRHFAALAVADIKRTSLERRLSRQLELTRRRAMIARRHMRRSDFAGELADLGWWEIDIAADVLSWSRAVKRIHGVPVDYRPTLADALDFYLPEARARVRAAVDESIATGEPFGFELPIRRRSDGARRWVRTRGQAVVVNGEVVRLTGGIQDITERREIAERIEHLAEHDALTGLPNRRQFDRQLAKALADGAPFALALIDVDHFKRINDETGHPGGDAALVALGERLRAQDGAFVARLGGDEFIVIVERSPGTSLDATLAALLAAANRPWRHADGPQRLGVSIGVACFPEDARDADALYQAADAALYAAKAEGRGQVRLAGNRRVSLAA